MAVNADSSQIKDVTWDNRDSVLQKDKEDYRKRKKLCNKKVLKKMEIKRTL